MNTLILIIISRIYLNLMSHFLNLNYYICDFVASCKVQANKFVPTFRMDLSRPHRD